MSVSGVGRGGPAQKEEESSGIGDQMGQVKDQILGTVGELLNKQPVVMGVALVAMSALIFMAMAHVPGIDSFAQSMNGFSFSEMSWPFWTLLITGGALYMLARHLDTPQRKGAVKSMISAYKIIFPAMMATFLLMGMGSTWSFFDTFSYTTILPMGAALLLGGIGGARLLTRFCNNKKVFAVAGVVGFLVYFGAAFGLAYMQIANNNIFAGFMTPAILLYPLCESGFLDKIPAYWRDRNKVSEEVIQIPRRAYR